MHTFRNIVRFGFLFLFRSLLDIARYSQESERAGFAAATIS